MIFILAEQWYQHIVEPVKLKESKTKENHLPREMSKEPEINTDSSNTGQAVPLSHQAKAKQDIAHVNST